MGTVSPMGPAKTRSYTTAELLRYMELTRLRLDGPAIATARHYSDAVASRYATSDGIAEILQRCEAIDPERDHTSAVWVAAANNPTTPRAYLHRMATSSSPTRWRDLAMANPGLGASAVEQLWAATENPELLANPHIAPALLYDHFDEHAEIIAVNPAASPTVLRRCWSTWYERVLVNPSCPRDLLDHALHYGNFAAGTLAALNPTLTTADLEALRDRRVVVAPTITRRLQRLRTTEAPTEVEARFTGELDVLDPLAELIDTDPDAADAVAALLRGHFDGTVGELIACASVITGRH